MEKEQHRKAIIDLYETQTGIKITKELYTDGKLDEKNSISLSKRETETIKTFIEFIFPKL